MTIATFCLDLLARRGPMPLEDLAAEAATAGATTSRSPQTSVRQAVQSRVVELPDGRLASPLALLEGRVLTTRPRCGSFGTFAPGFDLEPLRQPAEDGIPTAAGQRVRVARFSPEGSWEVPRGWLPDVADGEDVLAFAVRDGQLHVRPLRLDDAAAAEAAEHLREELAAVPSTAPHWSSTHPTEVAAEVSRRLLVAIAQGSRVLREPVPPLTECLPDLAAAAAQQEAEWEAHLQHLSDWHPMLALPGWCHSTVRDIAGGQPAEAWLAEWLKTMLAPIVVTRRW